MKYSLILVLSLLNLQCSQKENASKSAPKNSIVEQIHGYSIEDPYRNLENLNDSLVIDWLKYKKSEKERITNNIPERRNLEQRIVGFNKAVTEKVSKLYVSDNDYYYYLKEDTSENIKKLYYRNGFNGEETFLFAPEDFDKKTKYNINYIKPNWDDSKIVIGLTKNDEEFSTLVILDIEQKKIIPGVLITNTFPNALGGVKWLPDNSGLVYNSLPDINRKSEGYLQNSKVVIYNFEKRIAKTILSKKNNPTINIKTEDFPLIYLDSEDCQYVLTSIAGVSRDRDTYFAKTGVLNHEKINWKPLFKKEEKVKRFIVDGSELYYLTSKGASNFEICKVSLESPDFENPVKLVREDKTSVITDFAITKRGLFYVKIKNGVDAKLFSLEGGKEKSIPIPKPSGSINVSSKGSKYDDLWIVAEGWTENKNRYKFNYENNSFISENLYPVAKHNVLDEVLVEELEVASHDGAKVPLSIIRKKTTKLNGENRLLLTGYGAYGVIDKPILDRYLLNWINEGGIYVSAHVRGGGEKGDAWHKGGFKTTKSNTWKDFIACTEYLISNKYTKKEKLVAWSGSAGGILIGRAITERPDLFGAAIIRVGVLNTLRSEFAPNGKNNMKEYGSIKDSLEFLALKEMDAYHNIQDNVNYPSLYLTAGMKDARVAAWMPAKFAARLEEASTSNNPVILDIDFDGGHGFDASTDKKTEELANILSFAFWQTGHPDYQLKD